jgi:hypothetical protein
MTLQERFLAIETYIADLSREKKLHQKTFIVFLCKSVTFLHYTGRFNKRVGEGGITTPGTACSFLKASHV